LFLNDAHGLYLAFAGYRANLTFARHFCTTKNLLHQRAGF